MYSLKIGSKETLSKARNICSAILGSLIRFLKRMSVELIPDSYNSSGLLMLGIFSFYQVARIICGHFSQGLSYNSCLLSMIFILLIAPFSLSRFKAPVHPGLMIRDEP